MIDACPKNLDEIKNASANLECGFDRFGNSQYVCLPNTEKSSLIEFCYEGLMGLKEKGKITHTNGTELLHCFNNQYSNISWHCRMTKVYVS